MDWNIFLKSVLSAVIVSRALCWYDEDPTRQKYHYAAGIAVGAAVFMKAFDPPLVSPVVNNLVSPAQS
jgi:hypothetical protein